jgi:hypothetical protein
MTVMTGAELATWVPVALNLEEQTPSIDWGDFGGRRFIEPFFDETVALWAAEDPSPPMVRTDLDALVTVDQAPSLDPSGLIFHSSRCGSTLLARLLRQTPGCVVVSEPNIINTLLLADAEIIDLDTRVRMLRLLLRALGRRRFGDERHYVIKLSSWNVCRLALFKRAFPNSPVVWLQRRPAEVIQSLMAHSPAWLHWREKPELAAATFQIPTEEVRALEPAAFYVRALATTLQAALTAAPGITMPTIDYVDLPEASWTVVAPRFGMTPNADDVKRMQTEARYHAKESTPRVFERKTPNQISESVQRLAAEQLDGLYQALSVRKDATPGLPQSSVVRS